MHKSSLLRMESFIFNYIVGGEGKKVLDVGSYDVNGCYKNLFSGIEIEYVGLDIEDGPNVDVVMDEIYNWDSLQDEEFDYIISGQAFEHIEYPWLTMKEIYKKLKQDGIVCIIAPNGLFEHKYPIDCYRYYADGMRAMAEFAGLKVIEVSVAGIPHEGVSLDWDEISNDVCLVACKSKKIQDKYADKIMFPLERRCNPIKDLKAQCEFLAKWKCNGERIDHLITNFIKRGKYDKVYIVGYEALGIVLEKLLQSKEIDYRVIKTEKKPIAENIFFESGIMPGIDIEDKGKRIVCILTILYFQREINKIVERQCDFYDAICINRLIEIEIERELVVQMKKTFQSCSNVYIYGAGINGHSIFNILKENMFEIKGFVVSDNYYKKETNDNIYKISDISKDSGIIISPKDDCEIKKILNKLNFRNCFDGKRLLEIDIGAYDETINNHLL